MDLDAIPDERTAQVESHLDARAETWDEKAAENVARWGVQSPEVTLLAMMEELGELSQAVLQANYEEGDPARIDAELDDLAALCIQLSVRRSLEGTVP